ncbi:MAG TPA: acetylglutamate kinase, partial [Acidimicrobiales bacterium]|nr:acetylglutamate kinase [Acidimicrobiales bacterium]
MTRVVVKLGGHALDRLDAESPVLVALAGDIAELTAAGTDVVVVHGGGPQIGALLAERGVPERFVDGLRVTDAATLEAVAMALSLVNAQIVAALVSSRIRAVGLRGADSDTLRATPAGEPWGLVGIRPTSDPAHLEVLLSAGTTPVVSPLGNGGEVLLNVNADAAAGAIAAALGARLVVLSDVDQVLADPADPSSGITCLSRDDATAMLASGAARDGMVPKLRAALEALE